MPRFKPLYRVFETEEEALDFASSLPQCGMTISIIKTPDGYWEVEYEEGPPKEEAQQ